MDDAASRQPPPLKSEHPVSDRPPPTVDAAGRRVDRGRLDLDVLRGQRRRSRRTRGSRRSAGPACSSWPRSGSPGTPRSAGVGVAVVGVGRAGVRSDADEVRGPAGRQQVGDQGVVALLRGSRAGRSASRSTGRTLPLVSEDLHRQRCLVDAGARPASRCRWAPRPADPERWCSVGPSGPAGSPGSPRPTAACRSRTRPGSRCMRVRQWRSPTRRSTVPTAAARSRWPAA